MMGEIVLEELGSYRAFEGEAACSVQDNLSRYKGFRPSGDPLPEGVYCGKRYCFDIGDFRSAEVRTYNIHGATVSFHIDVYRYKTDNKLTITAHAFGEDDGVRPEKVQKTLTEMIGREW